MYFRNRKSDSDDDSYDQPKAVVKRRHRHSRTKIIFVLSAVLILESLMLFSFYIRLSILEKENLDLARSERTQAEELKTLKPRVEKLTQELAALTESRLPDLYRLEFDKVIPIERAYVRNIVFSMVGKGDQRHYEFKIVTQNGTLNLLHPELDILLFNRAGIQVGMARIGVQKDGQSTMEVLDRGEIRSFAARVELTEDADPMYFMLKIR